MIYFIQDEATLHIKIGFHGGADANERLRALQTGCPSPLVLLAVMPGTLNDERALHQRFASARVAGEWFRPVPNLLLLLVRKSSRADQHIEERFRAILGRWHDSTSGEWRYDCGLTAIRGDGGEALGELIHQHDEVFVAEAHQDIPFLLQQFGRF